MIRGTVLVQPSALRRKALAGQTRTGRRAISGVLTERRFFRFRKTIGVDERVEDGVWVHECKPLRIYVFGETPRESWQTFIEFFECNWDSIAQQKDSRLSLDAQALKRKYLEIVESVEPVL